MCRTTLAAGTIRSAAKLDPRIYAGFAAIDIEEYRVPLFSVIVEAGHEIGTKAHARVSSAYFHGAPNVGAHVHWKATWTASAEIREDDFKYYNAFDEIGPRLDPDVEQTKSIEGDSKLDERGFASLECESPFMENASNRTMHQFRGAPRSRPSTARQLPAEPLAGTFPPGARLGVAASEHIGTNSGVNVKIEALDPDDRKVNDIAVHADLYHVATKTAKEQVGPFVYRYRNTDLLRKYARRMQRRRAEFSSRLRKQAATLSR